MPRHVEDQFERSLQEMLKMIGEDPSRPGLVETPRRVWKAMHEMLSGYKTNPADFVKVFDDVGTVDEMVIAKNIEFHSFCEHHLLPFIGVAHVAYVPQDNRVIGLSKLGRIVDAFARRLQVQERLTGQVTECLDEHLKPLGSACVIEAKHLCMACRGVRKQQSSMVTSSMTGVFRKKRARSEFLSLVTRNG